VHLKRRHREDWTGLTIVMMQYGVLHIEELAAVGCAPRAATGDRATGGDPERFSPSKRLLTIRCAHHGSYIGLCAFGMYW
jgi:hypothetical protein